MTPLTDTGSRRFILIDHSITSIGGHHLEYARNVLEAAERAGFVPILITNRELDDIGALPWQVLPLYQHKFWSSRSDYPALLWAVRQKQNFEHWLDREKVKLAFSGAGVAADGTRQPVENPFASARLTAGRQVLRAGRKAAGFLKRVKGKSLRVLKRIRGTRQLVQTEPQPETQPAQADRSLRVDLKYEALTRTKAVAFERDTAEVFRRLGVQARDLVFIPTLGEAEMIGLNNYLTREPAAKALTWHLLFRRNLYPGIRKTETGSLRSFSQAFKSLERTAGDGVFFYTDTDELTRQYAEFTGFDFETLPIPVGDAFYQPEAGAKTPLKIVYAGDARTEKGYQYLPRLVQDSWREAVKPGLISYEFQSNYNVPQGEPFIVIARNILRGYAPEKVTLVKEALDSDAYRRLVKSADVVLIPYLAKPYQARSSGILAEALVAGIPVIVPAETWMALQLVEPIRGYVDRLLGHYPSVRIAGHDLTWQTQNYSNRLPDIYPSRRQSLSTVIPLDPGQYRYLAFTLDQRDMQPGAFLRVSIVVDGNKPVQVVLGGITGQSAALFRVPDGNDIRITLDSPYQPVELFPDHLRITQLQADQALPLSFAGCVFTQPADLWRCLSEVVTHYDHYRKTAGALADEMRAYHNPDRLVRELLAPSAAPIASGERHA